MRIAIYFAPTPGSAWWRFGACWLGRDPACARPTHAQEAAAQEADPSRASPSLDCGSLPGCCSSLGWGPEQRAHLAAEPRRYGFHATLVAPFRLAAGARIEDVSAAARAFVARHGAVPGVALHVSDEGGFVALRPAHAVPAVDALAFDAVRHFDALRARLDATDHARRARGLDARQLQLLDRWGYGRVADQYRFHLTLTDQLDAPERTRAADAARRVLDAHALHAIDVDGVAIFVEGEDRVFRIVQWCALPVRPAADRP